MDGVVGGWMDDWKMSLKENFKLKILARVLAGDFKVCQFVQFLEEVKFVDIVELLKDGVVVELVDNVEVVKFVQMLKFLNYLKLLKELK